MVTLSVIIEDLPEHLTSYEPTEGAGAGSRPGRITRGCVAFTPFEAPYSQIVFYPPGEDYPLLGVSVRCYKEGEKEPLTISLDKGCFLLKGRELAKANFRASNFFETLDEDPSKLRINFSMRVQSISFDVLREKKFSFLLPSREERFSHLRIEIDSEKIFSGGDMEELSEFSLGELSRRLHTVSYIPPEWSSSGEDSS